MHAPAPAPPPSNAPPSKESVRARNASSPANDIEWQSLLIACFSATCALLIWLVVGALTGLGKLSSLLFPVAIVVALVGAIAGLTRAALALWILTAVAIVGFCIIAMTPFVTTLLPTETMVREDPRPTKPLDAVVVLSGGITPDGLLDSEPLDRLLTALELMRDSVAPLLVVTEPHRGKHGPTAVGDQKRVRSLVARPFPMLTVDSVFTTHDEAVNSWRLLSARKATRIAVVTSPLHTHRACATFEEVGFTVTCVPAVSRAYSVKHADEGEGRLNVFRAWLYERMAWIEYRMRGWVPSSIGVR